jgi:hypothetical protein
MKKLILFLLTAAIGFSQINVTSADYVQQGKLTSVADAGANDTYTGCPTVPIRAYVTGMSIAFKPNTVNTGAASLNVCSLGAKSIKTVAGADPSDGDLAAGKWYFLTYDGTNLQITGGGGSGGGSGVTTIEGFDVVGTSATLSGSIIPELAGDNTYTGINNFSGATSLRLKTGTSDPGTCTVGDVLFRTDLTAGQNMKGCTSSNTWTALGSGSSTTTDEIYLPTASVTNGGTSQIASGFLAPNTSASGAGFSFLGTAPWRLGYATFPVDTTNIINLIGRYRLPSGWNGSAVNIELKWFPSSGASSAQVVKWGIESVCLADGELISAPTFNTVVTGNGTLGASPDSKIVSTTIAPSLTGCSAGETMYFRIQRNSTTGNGDTVAQTVNLISATFKYTRTL